MQPTKAAHLCKRFGKADLDDLFDLVVPAKVSAGDDRDQPLVPVEDLLECKTIAAEHQINELIVGSLDANGGVRDFHVSPRGESFILQSRRVTAHSIYFFVLNAVEN